MANRRLNRVSGVLLAELARLISRERTLEGTVLTVSAVDVTPDLRQAFVYVSILESPESHDKVMEKLAKLGFPFQKSLAQRTHLKNTPKLEFRYDNHLERGDKVLELLKELEESDEKDRQS